MTYPTTGHTYSISKQEADQNYHATLLAMVEAHPDNQYWRNLLDAHLLEIEIRHDNEWLGVDYNDAHNFAANFNIGVVPEVPF